MSVDPEEAAERGNTARRRYIYNQARCFRCSSAVLSWQLNARTCYACPTCQPRPENVADLAASGVKALAEAAPSKLFESHCAREGYTERSADPAKLKVKELKAELKAFGVPTTGKKADLVARLVIARHTTAVFGASPLPTVPSSQSTMPAVPKSSLVTVAAAALLSTESKVQCDVGGNSSSSGSGGGGGCEDDVGGGVAAAASVTATRILPRPGLGGITAFKTYAAARGDKVAAGERLNVEHVADVDLTASLVDWTDLHSDDKNDQMMSTQSKTKNKKKRKTESAEAAVGIASATKEEQSEIKLKRKRKRKH